MQTNLQRRIQRYGWNKAADHYERGWRESLAEAQARLLEMADAQPGETVVDMACGTGLVSFPLAEKVGPNGRVIATDISERMIEIVRQESTIRGVMRVDAFRADSEMLDMIQDASVDLVTCALGLMYFPDPLAAMKQAMRMLKPGGRAVFAVWGGRDRCGWADIFPIVDARVQSDVCPLFFRLGTGSTLAWEMALAGFSHVREERLSTMLPYDSADAAVSAAFAGGPVALAYERFDDDTRHSAHDEYLASIAAFRDGNGYRIPGEFVICEGRRAV
ncbi:class I SAM-dependent methyltransferase [Gimibacter soli]|uniref:Class I SAM-dependent methyltransferase n=1 Tax=Gimibacter soli TaxID=3024400 RepID=A0AAE9XTV8_9PROT|nr:class I SAM-dependent methyltransferase [Gimibacter soli]WCL53298.1 class I SAM-dependent methyltransferase [Gimibacter soli]